MTTDIIDQILKQAEQTEPFIKEHGSGSWHRLVDTVGRSDALGLCHLPRDEILVALRVDHGLTLQKAGDIFGITRERVRQITPSGLWHKNSEMVNWDAIAERVAHAAVRDKGAWSAKGVIKKRWIKEHFNEDIAVGVHSKINKLTMLLRWKLGLDTTEDQLRWLSEKYYDEGRSYADIAKLLSRKGIPISTMCVYRNAQEIGFRGESTGRPGRSRP